MRVNLIGKPGPCMTPGTRHGVPCDGPNEAVFDVDGRPHCTDCMDDSGLREETLIDRGERGWIEHSA